MGFILKKIDQGKPQNLQSKKKRQNFNLLKYPISTYFYQGLTSYYLIKYNFSQAVQICSKPQIMAITGH